MPNFGAKPSAEQFETWNGEGAIAGWSSDESPKRSPAPVSSEETRNGSQELGLIMNFERSM